MADITFVDRPASKGNPSPFSDVQDMGNDMDLDDDESKGTGLCLDFSVFDEDDEPQIRGIDLSKPVFNVDEFVDELSVFAAMELPTHRKLTLPDIAVGLGLKRDAELPEVATKMGLSAKATFADVMYLRTAAENAREAVLSGLPATTSLEEIQRYKAHLKRGGEPQIKREPMTDEDAKYFADVIKRFDLPRTTPYDDVRFFDKLAQYTRSSTEAGLPATGAFELPDDSMVNPKLAARAKEVGLPANALEQDIRYVEKLKVASTASEKKIETLPQDLREECRAKQTQAIGPVSGNISLGLPLNTTFEQVEKYVATMRDKIYNKDLNVDTTRNLQTDSEYVRRRDEQNSIKALETARDAALKKCELDRSVENLKAFYEAQKRLLDKNRKP
jgi:hypothetical protein